MFNKLNNKPQYTMKKLVIILLMFGAFCFSELSCTKEKVVDRIVYQDTIVYRDTNSTRMYLLDFIALEQTTTKSRVILSIKDLDGNINTSYDNSLYNVNTAQIHETNTNNISKAVYDSVNVTDYYRSTSISRPNNDTLRVIFRIGTMGDVDIKTL